jgi:hypothetical protein
MGDGAVTADVVSGVCAREGEAKTAITRTIPSTLPRSVLHDGRAATRPFPTHPPGNTG